MRYRVLLWTHEQYVATFPARRFQQGLRHAQRCMVRGCVGSRSRLAYTTLRRLLSGTSPWGKAWVAGQPATKTLASIASQPSNACVIEGMR
eukprot:3653562-Amphidinium_carterae.1